jgi:asparagine synthase (glutamine-hydrolysing)
VCGIAGLFDPQSELGAVRLERQAREMASVLAHRGPDDDGSWADPAGLIAFGHRRLAVVDLSPMGHQPMVSADGRWVLSYNGEIYNFRALRDRLSAEGVPFRGGSDTEVLLAAFERWGLDRALDATEGMFALSLWDQRRRELHLVRDRFGEKPLYYGWVGPLLGFGSELKALRKIPSFDATLDRDAVSLYLRYNCVPAPRTIYRGVAKLSPGELVTFSPSVRPGQLPAPRAYWSARDAVADLCGRPLTGSDEDLTDLLEETLDASVAARMVADVPVGAFLSGGVDSSVLVALMQRHSSQPVRTFTVGFSDRAFDESEDAAAVARHLGTDHTPLHVDDAEATAVIPQLPELWDEPFGDVSQIPTLLVSRLARTRVTVSLSGDGGDELFAGYNRHAWLERLLRQSSFLPAGLRRSVGAAMVRMPPGLVDQAAKVTLLGPRKWQVRMPSTKVVKAGKVLAAAGPEDAYLALVSHWDDPGSVLAPGVGGDGVAPLPDAWPRLPGLTEQVLWLDLVGYLPDDILVKLDRAAMAVSLESRAPFLDRPVFELAWRLPLSAKLRGGTTKWILREVLYRHVPRALVERPKMGFGVPIGAWLRGPLREWAQDLLSEGHVRQAGVLDPAAARRALGLHLGGQRDLGYELWGMLMLQSWLDRWRPAVA